MELCEVDESQLLGAIHRGLEPAPSQPTFGKVQQGARRRGDGQAIELRDLVG